MSEKSKRVTAIDEVEMYLELTKISFPDMIEGKTYKQISDFLNLQFGINCCRDDIFLLHELTVDDMEQSLRDHFETIGLYY